MRKLFIADNRLRGNIRFIFAAMVIILFNHTLYAGDIIKGVNIPANSERMRHDVEMLTSSDPPRNADNIASLDKAAEYILHEFKQAGCRTQIQAFKVDGKIYKNITCSFGPKNGERNIVGAHYDVYKNRPGADDNASGVAGMLELARLFYSMKPELKYRTDFVAFTLEEPHFFGTRHMGSHVYAKALADAGVKVRAMISLEMIGYFTDKPKSQRYPVFFLKWFYPDKGNYIAVVGKWGQKDLVGQVKKHMSAASGIGVESISAPSYLPGIDFSDHQSFWKYNYKGVMVTDTAFYRNANYHKKTDTIDTLNFTKMAEVVKGVYWTALNL